jgi:calcineurin-like phosphoesterase family protein
MNIITNPTKNIFFVSDTHFSHSNFLNFTDSTENKIRPFANADEMDDYMITNWNSVIKPNDRVYHLGDVGFNSTKNNEILKILNGDKRLILGNHDTIKGDLINHFKKIVLWRLFKEHNFICSHVPLREDSMFKVGFCVHGHIHQQPAPTIRHINICVECTKYTPLHLDEILAEIDKRNTIISNQLNYELVHYDYRVKNLNA